MPSRNGKNASLAITAPCNSRPASAALRAAIRAGTEIQALALTTESSRQTFAKFRDGVTKGLDARDQAFKDYRTKE